MRKTGISFCYMVSCCWILVLCPFLQDQGVNAFVNRATLSQKPILSGYQSHLQPLYQYNKKDTSLYVDFLGTKEKDPLTFGGTEPDIEDYIVIFLPALLTAFAFVSYDETNTIFHNYVEWASANTWQAVDGGAYLSDLLAPALNGPVVTSIALLFGSLTSITISNLYNRQCTLANAFTNLVEDIRLADIHFGYFPPEYDTKAKRILKAYSFDLLKTFEEELSVENMQQQRQVRQCENEMLMRLLHDLSSDKEVEVNGRVLDQSYATLNQIITRRCDMAAVYDQQFPLWHYGNLALLASAICTVFFILTDRSALVFLGAFQLRVCWALLVGTISLMSCVIYDLNTPLKGVFQIVKQADRKFLMEYSSVVAATAQVNGKQKETSQ